jgi:outer membrane protein TolC
MVAMLAGAAQAETRKLTVEDALSEAMHSYPQLVAARARARAGGDVAKSAIGRMLPSVHLANEYQHWDSPFNIAFGGMGFRVRNEDTNSFSASAAQPLLGLGRLSEDYLAQRGDADAAKQGLRAAEDEVRAGLRIGFLRYFEARAMTELALASAGQLDEQVVMTDAKVKAGVLTTADLLRVRVAADNARQQAIVARTQAAVSRAQVLAAVGLRPDDAIELVEPLALLQPSDARDGTIDQALAHRPEVAAARDAAQSADHRKNASTWALAPEIDAEGAYLRTDGQIFAPKDSAFVGVRASWPIWEWGASWYARQAAAAQAEAAHADLDGRKRQVEVEVATRNAELGAASSAVKLADETIVSAEEAYRVTEAQVRAGAATTTDLLDSQAALTQSRLNRARARYEEAIARVTLQRAVGDR